MEFSNTSLDFGSYLDIMTSIGPTGITEQRSTHNNVTIGPTGRNEHITTHDDATWILTSAIIIFTMQSGFGLLESGSVSVKNEANIMVKNVVDVIFGGLTYWTIGYGLSFGDLKPYANPFCGWGSFFVTASDDDLGWVYAQFFFQASFATTATTIVSGSMAERTKLEAYIIFSMLNTFIFAFPAHWMWATNGWLRKLGVVDIAGAGPVHIVGGVTGLIATLMLKPRHKRFNTKHPPLMGSPTNAILGMFMLWWGFLGFACGSTFGISGLKWKLAARSAVAAVCSSISGGVVGLSLSYILKNRKFDISYMINGILGSLVGITSTCALSQPWQALIIGFVGALVTTGTVALLQKLRIDDPVGCVGIHAGSGIWSLLAAGVFVKKDTLTGAIQLDTVNDGLIYSGSFKQLGIQCLAVLSIAAWTIVIGSLFLKFIDLTIGIRVPLGEEILGADLVEHCVDGIIYDKQKKRITHVPGVEDNNPDVINQTFDQLYNKSLVSERRHSLGYHIESQNHNLREIALYSQIMSNTENNQGEEMVNRLCCPCLHTFHCMYSKNKTTINPNELGPSGDCGYKHQDSGERSMTSEELDSNSNRQVALIMIDQDYEALNHISSNRNHDCDQIAKSSVITYI